MTDMDCRSTMTGRDLVSLHAWCFAGSLLLCTNRRCLACCFLLCCCVAMPCPFTPGDSTPSAHRRS